MQFENPEIFYFLPVLLIPILVHLFQLQKFEKVAFTNVAFLQKIIQDNRKSSRLKKWLILATRLLLLLAILFAFSQPFFSDNKNNTKQHTNIYIDNSLSTNSVGNRGDLLKNTVQEIIENASQEDVYSLQTNSEKYKNLSFDELKNKLLSLKNVPNPPNFKSFLLNNNQKNVTRSKTLDKNILITDLQGFYNNEFTNVNSDLSIIKLQPSTKTNLSIDSVYTNSIGDNNTLLHVMIRNQGVAKNNIPISLYNNKTLVSKQTFSTAKDTTQNVVFPIPSIGNFKGKINITFSDTYSFDNSFYFSLHPVKKINVLAIGKTQEFFRKIYRKDEFNFTEFSLQKLDYNALEKQDFIILNELKEIPEILSRSLFNFTKKGGTLLVIPNEDININSYNQLFKKYADFRLQKKENMGIKITKINFDHPLFKDVFSKKVTNFQYPNAQTYFTSNNKNSSAIISFENNSPFLHQIVDKNQNVYWFASSLTLQNTNFSKSPLIVPVFYNLGKLSFKHSQLYFHLGKAHEIDIDTQLNKEAILSIIKDGNPIIPQQQTYQNKATLTLQNELSKAGFYAVTQGKDTIQTLAFNNPKEESNLQFLEVPELIKANENITLSNSVSETLQQVNKKNEVHWLWKWFLGLAIVSLCLEILILKFYKP